VYVRGSAASTTDDSSAPFVGSVVVCPAGSVAVCPAGSVVVFWRFDRISPSGSSLSDSWSLFTVETVVGDGLSFMIPLNSLS